MVVTVTDCLQVIRNNFPQFNSIPNKRIEKLIITEVRYFEMSFQKFLEDKTSLPFQNLTKHLDWLSKRCEGHYIKK